MPSSCGAMALTRMPSGRGSTSRIRVKGEPGRFAGRVGRHAGRGLDSRPRASPCTMAPAPSFCMCGVTAWLSQSAAPRSHRSFGAIGPASSSRHLPPGGTNRVDQHLRWSAAWIRRVRPSDRPTDRWHLRTPRGRGCRGSHSRPDFLLWSTATTPMPRASPRRPWRRGQSSPAAPTTIATWDARRPSLGMLAHSRSEPARVRLVRGPLWVSGLLGEASYSARHGHHAAFVSDSRKRSGVR